MREIIDLAAATIEALAVVIIAIAIVHGSVRFLVDLAGKSAALGAVVAGGVANSVVHQGMHLIDFQICHRGFGVGHPDSFRRAAGEFLHTVLWPVR